MSKVATAVVLLASVWASDALAAAWRTDIESPPTMDSGYVLIQNKCPGEAGFTLSQDDVAGKDVKIEFPKDRKCTHTSDTLSIQGYENNPVHDVWIVGGHWDGFGIGMRNYDGTVFIEGLVIDMKCKYQDAFNSYYGRGNGGRFVIQNSHFTGINYDFSGGGVHGDIIHPQGTGAMVDEIKFENFWGHVVTQGLFVPPRPSGDYPGHGTEKLTLRNVFLAQDPVCAPAGGRGVSTMAYWIDYIGNIPPVNGVTFSNTYFKHWGGAGAGDSAPTTAITVPAASGFDTSGCAVYPSSAGVIGGGWCVGDPPEGTPAPLNKIGLNYSRSNFTTGGTTEPPPGTSTGVLNRIFAHSGLANVWAVMARNFNNTTSQTETVAFAYREHAKAAAPGTSDLCSTAGIEWTGDVADDAIYVTSDLTQPAALEVAIGTGATTTVQLPANQARLGQQSVIPFSGTGIPRFRLLRDGTLIKEWSGKLSITSSPAIRSVSTYSDYSVIGAANTQKTATFEAVSVDRQEGNSGSTPFSIRVRRNVGADTMTADCRVVAGTASASDFTGGALPAGKVTLSPNTLQADYVANVAGDTTQEGDETFYFTCDNVQPTDYSATASPRIDAIIRNDDAGTGAPVFSIKAVDTAVLEGSGGGSTPQVFEITRTGDIANRTDTVDFCPGPADAGTVSASASDFTGGVWPTETVSMEPNQTTLQRQVQIEKDNTPEPAESYAARLRFPSADSMIGTGSAVATIVDDDTTGTPRYIDSGLSSGAVTDSLGRVWSADLGTGGTTSSNAFDYAGTEDDILYRTHRAGPSSYSFDATAGLYRVYGMFAEHDSANDIVNCVATGALGRRLIQATVSATGGDTITSPIVDPYCDAGFRTAHIVELAAINAIQGKIKVDIKAATGSQATPLINAIYIEPYEEQSGPRSSDWIDLGAPSTSSYTDSAGKVWRGMPPSIATGCLSTSDNAKPAIGGTADDPLYWTTCRGADQTFTIPIDTSSGPTTRTLSLLFVEPTAGAGARVIDVYVNGVKQISDLDVVAAAGATNTALIRAISPVTVQPSGNITVRIVSTTGAQAIIAGLSVTQAMANAEYQTRVGWKGTRSIDKRALINAVSPTGLSQAGRPLVVRKLNTTSSTLYACHSACGPTATHGLQPDNAATNAQSTIQIMAHDPTNAAVSLFPALGVGFAASIEETFTVAVAELLPDGTLGSESTVTVRVRVTRAR